jgi:hypothetical protein
MGDVILNVTGKFVKEVVVGYVTGTSWENVEIITLSKVVRRDYPHPKAPEDAVITMTEIVPVKIPRLYQPQLRLMHDNQLSIKSLLSLLKDFDDKGEDTDKQGDRK